MYNKKFDPLNAKYEGHETVVMLSIQREINNILNSYVGWFDPLCELIQKCLRFSRKKNGYRKTTIGTQTEHCN